MGRDKRQGNELTAKVLAAALTPLAADGESVDLSAVEAYCHYLADGSVDGAFILGTTGEGMLLTNPERKLVTEAFVAAAGGTMDVVAHCGAQTTAATVDLAAHAVRSGATATAVIPPPYFTLTDVELLEHLTAAARASEPLPFYVYQFEARSGYATPISVIERLQASCENLGGIKVSDTPYAKFERYLDCGIDVLVGPEEFIPRALRPRGRRGGIRPRVGVPELCGRAGPLSERRHRKACEVAPGGVIQAAFPSLRQGLPACHRRSDPTLPATSTLTTEP